MRALRMRAASASGCHAAALQLVLERLSDLRARARGMSAAADAQRKQEVSSLSASQWQMVCLINACKLACGPQHAGVVQRLHCVFHGGMIIQHLVLQCLVAGSQGSA